MQRGETISNQNQQDSNSRSTIALTSEQQPNSISSPVQESSQEKTPGKWLIVGLLALTLTALGVTGFFAYRCHLRHQISEEAQEIKSTPTPTSLSISKTPPSLERIGIFAVSPTQLLVTSPDGKKTGFDSLTGRNLKEIPKSDYYFQSPIADPSGKRPAPPPDVGQNKLSITYPPKSFTLEVSSKDDFYSFAFYASGPSLYEFESFEGPISTGERVIYEFEYTPELEFPFRYHLVEN